MDGGAGTDSGIGRVRLRFAKPHGWRLKGLLPLSVVLPLAMARMAIRVARQGFVVEWDAGDVEHARVFILKQRSLWRGEPYGGRRWEGHREGPFVCWCGARFRRALEYNLHEPGHIPF